MVTDRLTKEAHMIAWKEASIVEDLAHMFLKEIIVVHGALEEKISDRD